MGGYNTCVRDLLKKHFGYEFKPLQEEIISSVMEGRDVLALMPTGSGKSLCYQLPALMLDGVTLVVSPLIALMKDQVDDLKTKGVEAAYINSSLTRAEIEKTQRRALRGEIKILYAAPERLAVPGFQDFLDRLEVSLVAVDEAHCISMWGHEFRPEYRNLGNLRLKHDIHECDEHEHHGDHPEYERDIHECDTHEHHAHLTPEVPIAAFTATATERVREDIVQQLRLDKPQRFVASFNRPNLRYTVLYKRPNQSEIVHRHRGRPIRHTVLYKTQEPLEELLGLLRKYQDESVIIYCSRRDSTEELARYLRREGFSALPYHAGLDEKTRDEAQEWLTRSETQERFMRDEVKIVTATIAFGMGVDKPNIRLIVHYDLPNSVEGYYQETGRAGRDGLPSECVLFYSREDKRKPQYFIDRIRDKEERRRSQERLDQVIKYSELESCRREYLLNYFAEDWPSGNCQGCDVCLATRNEFDATEIALKFVSAVVRTGERFWIGYVSSVLLGAKTERIREYEHDKLSVYGIVNDFTRDELKEIAELLIAEGLLYNKNRNNTVSLGAIGVTADGYEFLSKRTKLFLWRKRWAGTAVPSPERGVKQVAKKRGGKVEEVGAAAPSPYSDDLEYDRELFEILRRLRSRIASKRGVPPYMVFSNKTLRQMAYWVPLNRDSLSRIDGVGEVELEEFGEVFLTEIRAHKLGLSERAILARRRRVATAKPQGPTYDRTKPLPQKGESVEDVARAEAAALSLDSDGLEYDRELFGVLRRLRSRIASERGVAPHMVFGDDTLQQMAYRVPQSRDSLSRIHGVGEVKLEQFGDVFLTVIRAHVHRRATAKFKGSDIFGIIVMLVILALVLGGVIYGIIQFGRFIFGSLGS